MQKIIIISNSQPITAKEYQGQRVITFKDIDTLHQRPEGTARKRFNDNRERYIESTDYFVIDQPSEIRTLGFERPQGGTPSNVILLTKMGYLMLAKSLNDDLAWEIQRGLIKNYFETHDIEPSILFKLNSIESRLSLLETKEEACKEERQSDIFLKALQDALDSGEYYIRPKRAHAPESCTSRLLGVYDRHEIAIRSLPAYALYQAATSRPMRIRTLWEVLEREGTIAPRTEAGRICKISGKECAAVFISRNSLTVGGRG